MFGPPTLKDVEKDVLQAEEVGKGKKAFVQNCFKDGMPEKLFFKPILNTKLKTMEETYETRKSTRTQRNVFHQILH